jgi:hypothetical protein
VQLNRGGKKVALKPLPDDCAVRFNFREAKRASFRAILVRGERALLRSDPARVGPARRP